MTAEPPAGLPERRRIGYKELSEKLDEHAERIEKRVESFIKHGLIAFSIVAIACSVSLVGFGFILREVSRQSDEIQRQRRDSISSACLSQNARHDATILQLNKQIAAVIKQHPDRAKEVRSQVKFTIALIEAIVPKQDCKSLVLNSVEGG